MKVLSFKSEKEIIEISADTAADIKSLWSRFKARVHEDSFHYCNYYSSLKGNLQISLPTNNFQLEPIGKENSIEWKNEPPVFYETATYNISIFFDKVKESPVIIHKLKEVEELFTTLKVGDNKWLLSAPLSFINQPGIFELKYKYKPLGQAERTDKFEFRIVSPKLDTKKDYNQILSDINSEYHEVIFQYLTLTLQNLQRGGKSSNDVIWLSIFRNIAKEYENWVRFIVNKPHLRHTKEIRYDKADRIKRWTPRMEELYYEEKENQNLDRKYFRNEINIHTHNTRENRFVKFTLDRIDKRLTHIVEEIKKRFSDKKGKEGVSNQEIEELENYSKSLKRLGRTPLMRTLKGEPLHSESIVLQKKTGYSQIYKYWLILQKGIELFEGYNSIGVRPIWELYELWCFLKMREMIAEILGLSFSDPSEIKENPMPMVKPFEDNEQEHTVTFLCKDESTVKLHYQHTYKRDNNLVHTATTENRPDIVLTIIKPNSFELTYLFDAKYRLLDDSNLNSVDREEYEIAKGADTPPPDAINQMHRYRDAIYYGSDKQTHSAKEIIGGYIIFPGRGDKDSIRNRYFYKSIETVNIGAFPLLPDSEDPSGKKSLLYDFLTKILTTQKAYDHIKDAIPQKGLQYHSEDEPKETELILVGFYEEKDWDNILKNKLYYVPAALGKGSINLVSGFEKTKYLLLHTHKNQRILVPLKGNGPRFFPRTELEKMGFSPSGDFYLGFDIKNFTPIKDLDPYSYEFERKGPQKYSPYFTTIDKLKNDK